MADRSSLHSSSIPTLFLLYFLQGLPYGFQVKLLPLLLRAKDFSLTRVSFTRILSLPWILKFVVAPFVDQTGFLHLWITTSLAGMSALYLFSAVAGSSDVFTLLCCVFGLNVLSAVQDVAVDALAMQLLKSYDLGKGNTAQVVGYKFGALFGGGIFAWLAAITAWDILLGSMSCFYLLLAALLFLHLRGFQESSDTEEKHCRVTNKTSQFLSSDETKMHNKTAVQKGSHLHKQGKYSIKSNVQDSQQTRHSQNAVGVTSASYQKTTLRQSGIFSSIFYSPGFAWLVLYVVVYKLGEQGAASMFPLFLLDQGFSREHVGFISGICGQAFSIGGSTFGGWLVTHHSGNRAWLIKILLCASVARLLTLTSQWISTMSQTNLLLATASESTLQFIAGVVTTATFTLMMSVSQESAPGVQATHFSVLATAEVVGKLFMISLSGVLVDWMGYCVFLGLCWALSFAVLPVLYKAPMSVLTHKEL